MITYLELLQMIKENRPPKRVLYGRRVWEWNGRNYTRKLFSKVESLGIDLAYTYSDLALAKDKIIELLPDVPGGNV